MRLTVNQLRRIIKEEVAAVMGAGGDPASDFVAECGVEATPLNLDIANTLMNLGEVAPELYEEYVERLQAGATEWNARTLRQMQQDVEMSGTL